MRLTIVGAGRAAWLFGSLWARAARGPVTLLTRDAPDEAFASVLGAEPRPLEPASLHDAGIVLFAVSDRAIPELYAQLQAAIPPRVPVFHPSGSLSSELFDHQVRFSLHPLCSLPPLGTPSPRLDDTLMVFEGVEAGIEIGREITRLAGGEFRAIETSSKPLYHAAAVFGSNYVATSLSAASALMTAAGIDQTDWALRTLAVSAIDNWASSRESSRFTGPIARGDVEVVQTHLEALEPFPAHRQAYRALARLLLGAIEADQGNSDLREIARLIEENQQS